MRYQEALTLLDRSETLTATCPDGVERVVWGYNGATGDLFVAGWRGDVWMDCSSGELRAELDPED